MVGFFNGFTEVAQAAVKRRRAELTDWLLAQTKPGRSENGGCLVPARISQIEVRFSDESNSSSAEIQISFHEAVLDREAQEILRSLLSIFVSEGIQGYFSPGSSLQSPSLLSVQDSKSIQFDVFYNTRLQREVLDDLQQKLSPSVLATGRQDLPPPSPLRTLPPVHQVQGMTAAVQTKNAATAVEGPDGSVITGSVLRL